MNANAEATKPLFSLQDRIVVVAGGGSGMEHWSRCVCDVRSSRCHSVRP